ncbi:MAG: acylphosphatase [Candidatus Omnitrophota bacterium]
MANIRKHVLIGGLVQGVFFRSYTVDRARSLGLTGWVKNRWDGRVEAVFEGEETAVDSMVEWCRKGPPSSNVGNVDITSEKYTGEFSSFYVEY